MILLDCYEVVRVDYSKNIWKEENWGYDFVFLLVCYKSVRKSIEKCNSVGVGVHKVEKVVFGPTMYIIALSCFYYNLTYLLTRKIFCKQILSWNFKMDERKTTMEIYWLKINNSNRFFCKITISWIVQQFWAQTSQQ